MDLRALAAFHLVALHGGYGLAARATGQSKATLSRRVADLETALNLRLFERGAGEIRLTEEGRFLLASTQGPLDELNATEDALRGHDAGLQGRLRVSVPTLVASDLMGRLAARFMKVHPNVRLELTAEDRYIDLIQEGFDVVVRANPRPDDDLVGRCFLKDRLLVVAHPAFPRASQGSVPAVVRAVGTTAEVWRVEHDGRHEDILPDPVLRLSTLAMRDAVLSGAGVGLLPHFHVEKDLAEGRLVSWGVLTDRVLEIWILHASARLASRKLRAFVEFVIQEFQT